MADRCTPGTAGLHQQAANRARRDAEQIADLASREEAAEVRSGTPRPAVKRILVTGSRNFDDIPALVQALDRVRAAARKKFGTDVRIIQGGARGADSLAAEWARRRGVEFDEYRADWNKHGKRAGFLRNRQMLDEGKPDMVVAFPVGESRGTRGMMKIAGEAGVTVWEPLARGRSKASKGSKGSGISREDELEHRKAWLTATGLAAHRADEVRAKIPEAAKSAGLQGLFRTKLTGHIADEMYGIMRGGRDRLEAVLQSKSPEQIARVRKLREEFETSDRRLSTLRDARMKRIREIESKIETGLDSQSLEAANKAVSDARDAVSKIEAKRERDRAKLRVDEEAAYQKLLKDADPEQAKETYKHIVEAMVREIGEPMRQWIDAAAAAEVARREHESKMGAPMNVRRDTFETDLEEDALEDNGEYDGMLLGSLAPRQESSFFQRKPLLGERVIGVRYKDTLEDNWVTFYNPNFRIGSKEERIDYNDMVGDHEAAPADFAMWQADEVLTSEGWEANPARRADAYLLSLQEQRGQAEEKRIRASGEGASDQEAAWLAARKGRDGDTPRAGVLAGAILVRMDGKTYRNPDYLGFSRVSRVREPPMLPDDVGVGNLDSVLMETVGAGVNDKGRWTKVAELAQEFAGEERLTGDLPLAMLVGNGEGQWYFNPTYKPDEHTKGHYATAKRILPKRPGWLLRPGSIMNAQGEVVGSRVKAPVTGISWMSTGVRDTEHSVAGVYEAAVTAAADVRFERRQEGERQRHLEEERKRQDEQAEREGQAEEHRTTSGFFANALTEARAVFGDGPQFPAKSSEDMSRMTLGGLHKWAYRHLALRTLSLQQRIEGGWYVGNEPIQLIENLHLLSRLSSDPAVAYVLQQAARSVNATRNMIEAVGDTARELNRSEMAQGHIWDAVVSLTVGADMAGVGAKPVAIFDDDIKETLKGEGEPARDAAEGAILPRDIEQRFRQTLQEWQDEANSLDERAELFLKQTEGEAKTLPQVEAKVGTEEYKKNERVREALKEHGANVKVSRDGDIWVKARHYRVLVKGDPHALGTHWSNADPKYQPDFEGFSLVISPHTNRMRFNTPGGRVPITTGKEGLPRMLTVEEVIPR